MAVMMFNLDDNFKSLSFLAEMTGHSHTLSVLVADRRRPDGTRWTVFRVGAMRSTTKTAAETWMAAMLCDSSSLLSVWCWYPCPVEGGQRSRQRSASRRHASPQIS